MRFQQQFLLTEAKPTKTEISQKSLTNFNDTHSFIKQEGNDYF